MTFKLSIYALASLLATCCWNSASGGILFQISNLQDGTTNWQLVSSSTTYTVSSTSPTGNYGEDIVLPKNAFTFNYSQSFAITFNNPIGRITNLTTGTSVPLNRIAYYLQLDQLQIVGGVLDHAVGDQFQITDFSSSVIAIPYTTLTATRPTGYSQPGAFHTDSQIDINPVPVPEPSALALAAVGGVALLLRFRRRD